MVEFEYKEHFKTDDGFYDWMVNYYKNPSPTKAIDAYIYYSKSKLNEKNFISKFSFFLRLFNNNHFLIPFIKNEYIKQNFKTKTYIIWLLKYLDYDSKDFLNQLTGDERKIYDQLKDNKIPVYTDEVTTGEHLDIQWYNFFATGQFEPIQNIIKTLKFSKYSGSMDAYKNSKKTESDKEKAWLDATFQSARWSLISNMEQHELVKKYCLYSFIHDQYTTDVKLWLGFSLSKAYPERVKMEKNDEGGWTFKY